MIYVRHNFTENYSNAEGNPDLAEDILMQSVARLIVTHPFEVRDLLEDYGLKVGELSYSERKNKNIASLVAFKAAKDEAFRKDLALLILKVYGGKPITDKVEKMRNADGKKTIGSTLRDPKTGETLTAISNLTAALGSTFGKKQSTTTLQDNVKKQEDTGLEKKGMSPAMKIALWGVGIAAVGVIGFFVYKKFIAK